MFDKLLQHQLKMNPLKCASFFNTLLYSGKFLGFMVCHRGIEIDPTKMKTIIELPPPNNIRELREFQSRIAYIRRFISNLPERCKPFSKLMKKDASFEWDEDCQHAFESIKTYLTKPPVLSSPIKGKPLVLYIVSSKALLAPCWPKKMNQGRRMPFTILPKLK